MFQPWRIKAIQLSSEEIQYSYGQRDLRMLSTPSYWGLERENYTDYGVELQFERDMDLAMQHFLGNRRTTIVDPLGGNGPSWKRWDTQMTSEQIQLVSKAHMRSSFQILREQVAPVQKEQDFEKLMKNEFKKLCDSTLIDKKNDISNMFNMQLQTNVMHVGFIIFHLIISWLHQSNSQGVYIKCDQVRCIYGSIFVFSMVTIFLKDIFTKP